MPDNYDSSAEELYRDLEEALQAAAPQTYRLLRAVLRRSVEPFTRFTHLQHPSLFAKLNYLMNQQGVPAGLRRRVNAARSRMRHASAGGQASHAAADVRAVADWVAWLYAVPVPADLLGRLPAAVRDPAETTDEGLAPCLRLVVSAFTPTTVTGQCNEADGQTLTVDYGPSNPYFYGRDWSYLAKLLHEGAQLNVVRPHRAPDGVLHPELLILEPDLLMDITAVVSCMESYADSPAVHLLSRLRADQATAPILLGQFASQMLDESLRGLDRPYAESARDFFRQYPLLLATTPLPDTFHKDAQRQAANIREAVRAGLNAHVKGFRSSAVVLEPTFFCETLGLQGRMDMLQLDFRVLLEQKGGKGGWPPNADPEVPVAQEKHYAQALLYMAVLHYGLDLPNEQVMPFLLYSKYRKGLLNVAPAPRLLHLALQLRNQMARCEQLYAEKGYDVLLTLTPDKLRQKQGSEKLWQQYKRPELEALLSPVHAASPLERAYYLRFLRFVSTEHILGKVGNTQKEGSGFAASWHDTLADKLLAGNIYAGLTLVSPSGAEATDVSEVTLAWPEASHGLAGTDPAADDAGLLTCVEGQAANFRQGDIVVVYPYAEGDEPDLRRTPCLRGTLAELRGGRITLRLRAPQSTARFFYPPRTDGRPIRWAVEHDFYESSSATLFRGLHAFLSAPRCRRDLVLLQRKPEVDASLRLRGDYGAFNDLALRVRQARELFLIIGPPGTGKTSFGLMTTLCEELESPEAAVLVVSYTNRAVDEACSKLIEAGIDFIRIGGSMSCSEACRPYLLENRVATLESAAEVRDLVARTRVFAGTTAALCNHQELFRLRSFSLAIVDEASQILEPQILPLLAATAPPAVAAAETVGGLGKTVGGLGETVGGLGNASPTGGESGLAIRKFVLIGDHKQLPAVVQQSPDQAAVADAGLQQIGLSDCRQSLFERLLHAYRHDPAVCYMLTSQGRMHPDVADFPNRAFYDGLLRPVPLPHQQAAADGPRVEFIPADLPLHPLSDKVNAVEADIIARLITDNGWKDEVGVIVPYRNQIAAIRSRLPDDVAARVAIDTVERFQGSQRRVIIYGFTVQRRYQLRFLTSHTFSEDGHLIDRKLNVAMTRAMERLILVGHAPLLRQAPVFRQLLDELLPAGG